MPFAARVTDPTIHPLPGVLVPGPGCPTVMIGFMPAWRGINPAALGALQAAKATADAGQAAAAGTPGLPAAQAAALTAMTAAISGAAAMGGADIHACVTPAPPHGPGVVITPSTTVMIGGLGAARQGDDILEALSPGPNKIAMGCPTVQIG